MNLKSECGPCRGIHFDVKSLPSSACGSIYEKFSYNVRLLALVRRKPFLCFQIMRCRYNCKPSFFLLRISLKTTA